MVKNSRHCKLVFILLASIACVFYFSFFASLFEVTPAGTQGPLAATGKSSLKQAPTLSETESSPAEESKLSAEDALAKLCSTGFDWVFSGDGLTVATVGIKATFEITSCRSKSLDFALGFNTSTSTSDAVFESWRADAKGEMDVFDLYFYNENRTRFIAPETYWLDGKFIAEYTPIVSGDFQAFVFLTGTFGTDMGAPLGTLVVTGKDSPKIRDGKTCSSLTGINKINGLFREGGWVDEKYHFQDCSFRPLSSTDICDSFVKRGIKRVTLIGDSFSRHIFITLFSLLDGSQLSDNDVFELFVKGAPAGNQYIRCAPTSYPVETRERCFGKKVYKLLEGECSNYITGAIPVCNGNVQLSVNVVIRPRDLTPLLTAEPPDLLIVNHQAHAVLLDDYTRAYRKDEFSGMADLFFRELAYINTLLVPVYYWISPTEIVNQARNLGTFMVAHYLKEQIAHQLARRKVKFFDTTPLYRGGFHRLDGQHCDQVFDYNVIQFILNDLVSE